MGISCLNEHNISDGEGSDLFCGPVNMLGYFSIQLFNSLHFSFHPINLYEQLPCVVVPSSVGS